MYLSSSFSFYFIERRERMVKESDLYDPVKAWLEDKGWEVYAEVSGWHGVADIVGKQSAAYCVVEMKTRLSHEVIDQAIRWVGWAQYIFIAIPQHKKRLPKYLSNLFKEKGIGVIHVHVSDLGEELSAECHLKAQYRKAYMLDKHKWTLREEQKDFVKAGSPGGAHWTPYKATMEDVEVFLRHSRIRDSKGCSDSDGWRSLEGILDHCETHYARPKPSLSKSLREFESDWCETKVIGRKIHFRYKEKVG